MGALIIAIGKVFYDALRNPTSAGTIDENVALGFIKVYQILTDFARGVVFVLSQVYGAKKYEFPLAQKIGHDIQTAQIDTQNTISHVAFTILPNSLNYAVGYVWSHGITPLEKRFGPVESALKFLLGWRGQIDFWRKRTVDPFIVTERNFQKWFATWPITVLNTWHDWLTHPNQFAAWADPPIAATLPGYLASGPAKRDRDNLSAVLLTAWPEDTKVTQDLINRWLLSPP